MRKVFFGAILIGALGSFTMLGGCASVESVEAAQKVADTALTTATAAQASANNAHQVAGQALAGAQAAQSSAQMAQQTADKANSAVAEQGQQMAELQAKQRRRGERD
ncbi:MAG TPA: hypothetical protein VJ750_01080 [Rhizomicrobium sp.]|nr:hypothetical protein [Rhizomicrobium sp.]